MNIENNNYKSHSIYHNWVNRQKQLITPNKITYKENDIVYDLKCNPFDYFGCMIFMMKQIENEQQKIYNVFPMRTEIIPKHIRIDTTTLVHLLITEKQGTKKDFLNDGNLKLQEDRIWKFFFRTEKKIFHKNNYEYHHMIETDGTSCTILFRHNRLKGLKKPKKNKKEDKLKKKERYIDELDDYLPLKNKKIVAIDPGKCDLIYCVNSSNKKAKKFRYSQNFNLLLCR